jgi:hypothetical protein
MHQKVYIFVPFADLILQAKTQKVAVAKNWSKRLAGVKFSLQKKCVGIF